MPTDKTNQIQVDDNKTYLITGASLNKLLAAIKAAKPIAGTNITIDESDSGTTINGA